MKKITALLLTFVLVMACVGCGKDEDPSSGESSTGSVESSEGTEPVESGSESTEPVESGSESTESGEAGSEGVLTHEEYMAAAVDTEVVIEAYVQAKQSWWEDKATIYAQDEDGAYFLYNMVCSEEDYAKLTPGTKIRATGFKAEWAGEIEIMEGTFEILEGNYIAEAEDVTALLGSEDLIDLQNKFVAFKGMTVEASKDPDGNEVAFLYNYDGSGQEGDDLYFNVSVNGATYTFTVESYLCDSSTDVYQAVKGLNVGDTVDMEGYLYWYEGVNPHITSLTVK